jgi:3-oxoacyl-[acyl-carrier protein] reductase
MPMQTSFPKSHVALICGGAAPIGLRIAMQLAESGCENITLAGRDAGRGEAAIEQLRKQSPEGRFAFVRADISEPGGVDAMFAAVAEQYGALDSYVHCVPPGGGASGPLASADRTRFRSTLNVGLGGLADACHGAAAALKGRGGAMVLFASDAGRAAAPNHSLTGVVQGGIIALTRSLALELAREKIRVNCVSPTYVADTPLFDRLLQLPSAARSIEKAQKRAALGLPTPDDIAPLALFLLSAAASKITGQIISVNGGLSAN